MYSRESRGRMMAKKNCSNFATKVLWLADFSRKNETSANQRRRFHERATFWVSTLPYCMVHIFSVNKKLNNKKTIKINFFSPLEVVWVLVLFCMTSFPLWALWYWSQLNNRVKIYFYISTVVCNPNTEGPSLTPRGTSG